MFLMFLFAMVSYVTAGGVHRRCCCVEEWEPVFLRYSIAYGLVSWSSVMPYLRRDMHPWVIRAQNERRQGTNSILPDALVDKSPRD